MRKFLFCFFVFLLAKHASSFVSNGQDDLTRRLVKMSEKVGQLRSHVGEIEDMTTDRELDLSDDELNIEIESLIDDNQLLSVVRDELNDVTCQDIFSAGYDMLYEEINNNVTITIRNKLLSIREDLIDLEESVNVMEETITRELKRPETSSITCGNNNDDCVLIDNLLAVWNENFAEGNVLKEKLLKLNDESLADIKDHSKLLARKIESYILEPVAACIREKSDTNQKDIL